MDRSKIFFFSASDKKLELFLEHLIDIKVLTLMKLLLFDSANIYVKVNRIILEAIISFCQIYTPIKPEIKFTRQQCTLPSESEICF